jgi:hypothetical protein
MGIFSGGGFFGSGGKTNSGNTTNDNRTTANTTSQTSYTGDNISQSFGAMQNSNITMTDYGAINKSFDFLEHGVKIVDDAMQFTAGATQAILDNTLTTVTSNSEVVDNAFEFAAGSQMSTQSGLSDNLDFIDSETDDILSWAAGAVSTVVDQINKNTNLAYNDIADTKMFTAGLTTKVLDDSKDSYQRNLAATQASHENSMMFASGAFNSAVSNIRASADKGFQILDEATKNVLNGIAEFTGTQVAGMADNQTEAIEAIKNASKSESQQTSENMMKFGLGMAAVIGIAFIVARKRKGSAL